ncbi:MAG: heterocyst frequency control protein PatD [Cyanobacteria bacterium J06627_8]
MVDSRFDSYADVLQILRQMLLELESGETQLLKQQHTKIQHIFQAHILTTDIEQLQPLTSSQLQSIHTEMSRELRLLYTELMFLSTARNQTTVEQRKTQVGDRLNRLIQYCEFVLQQSQTSNRESDA